MHGTDVDASQPQRQRLHEYLIRFGARDVEPPDIDALEGKHSHPIMAALHNVCGGRVDMVACKHACLPRLSRTQVTPVRILTSHSLRTWVCASACMLRLRSP